MTVAAVAGRSVAGRAAAGGAARSAGSRATTGATRRRAASSAAGKPKPQPSLTDYGLSTGDRPADKPKPVEEPVDQGAEQQPKDSGKGISISLPSSGVARDASWAILGFLAWGWVVMPFLENGVPGVKKVLMAKFLNRRPDGSLFE